LRLRSRIHHFSARASGSRDSSLRSRMTQRVQDSGKNRTRRLLGKEMLVQAAGSRGPSTPQTPLRMTQKNSGRDDTNWMRRFGTGTGFACAKLSEVLPRSERSLASVRMTELGKMEIKK